MLAQLTGHVVIVMGPTGSGKGTVVRHALATIPDIHQTISCTTRDMRPGEVDGEDYHFLSADEFSKKIEQGEFIEWAWFGKNRYGTLKSEIVPRLEQGELVITEIELQGVEQLRTILPPSVMTVVYIEAGEWEVLAARARARAPITDIELEQRKERYLVEVQAKPLADVVIDNTTDDFSAACDSFVTLLQSVQQTLTKNT